MNFFFRLRDRDKIAFINAKFKNVLMKPFIYFNCVVFSFSRKHLAMQRDRQRERERKNGVLSSAELVISILSIFCSISF